MKHYVFTFLFAVTLICCNREKAVPENRKSDTKLLTSKKSVKSAATVYEEQSTAQLLGLIERGLSSDTGDLGAMLCALMRKDVALGLEWFGQLTPEQMGLFSSEVLSQAYEQDPKALSLWMDTTGVNHPAKSTILSSFLIVLSILSPEEGLNLIKSKRYPFEAVHLSRFYQYCALKNQSFLENHFKQIPAAQQGMARSALAKELMKSSPLAAIDFLRSHSTNDLSYRQALADAYGVFAMRDWKACLTVLESESIEIKLAALGTGNLMDLVAQKDPQKAIALVAELPLTTATQGAYWKTAQALAKNHPDQATAWLNQLADVPAKTEIARVMFRTMLFEHEATTAMAQVELLSGSAQQAARRSVVAELAKSDFDQALTIAKSVSETQQQDVFREIARSSAYENPQNAVSMINDATLSEKLGEQFRNEMINHTVQNWAKQDREAAQQWVEKLPASDQPKGVQGLVATWMKTDPIAASEWLSQQPAGPARDAGAQEIINQIKDTDPEMAEQWRKSMTPKTE